MALLTHLRVCQGPLARDYQDHEGLLERGRTEFGARAKGGNVVNGLADVLRINGAGVSQRVRWCRGAGAGGIFVRAVRS